MRYIHAVTETSLLYWLPRQPDRLWEAADADTDTKFWIRRTRRKFIARARTRRRWRSERIGIYASLEEAYSACEASRSRYWRELWPYWEPDRRDPGSWVEDASAP